MAHDDHWHGLILASCGDLFAWKGDPERDALRPGWCLFYSEILRPDLPVIAEGITELVFSRKELWRRKGADRVVVHIEVAFERKGERVI